jgi:nitroreductase
MEDVDFFSSGSRPEPLMPTTIVVDSLEEYEELQAACLKVAEMPESGKAFPTPWRVVWLRNPDTLEATAPIVAVDGLTTEAADLLSAVLGRKLLTVSRLVVNEAYGKRLMLAPAWSWAALKPWFADEGYTAVFSGKNRPALTA